MQVKLERQLQAEDLNIVYESFHQYDVILLLRNIFYQNHIFKLFCVNMWFLKEKLCNYVTPFVNDSLLRNDDVMSLT